MFSEGLSDNDGLTDSEQAGIGMSRKSMIKGLILLIFRGFFMIITIP